MIGRRRERAIASWRTALRETGRVEIEPRRWLLVLVAILTGGLGVLFLVGAAAVPDPVGTRLLLAGLGLLLGAVATVSLRALGRGPALVVDREGLHLGPADLDIPWAAVRGVFVLHVKAVPILCAHLDRDAKRELVARYGRALRAVHRLDDTVTLGALVRANPHHLAAWLDEEARQR